MTRIQRPIAVLAGAAAACITVACLDISSPVTGIASATLLLSPSPSVVEGDLLRDTAGAVAPVRAFAFAANGDTVTDAVVRYYAIDSTGKLHVDSVTGIVTGGDSVSPNAAVFARIWPAKGKGFLDTPLDTIPVVPAPVKVTRDTNFVFQFNVLATDTNATDLTSAPFGGTVLANGDTAVQRYAVGFQLVRRPAPGGSDTATVVLISALSTNDSSYAITDASGHASLRLKLRKAALRDSVRSGLIPDTAMVVLRVRGQSGQLVPVAPPDTIVITIRGVLPP